MRFTVVVPWVTEEERARFLEEWSVTDPSTQWLIMEQDETHAGCGATKNKGIQGAVGLGAEVVVILDGDCYPEREGQTLSEFAEAHVEALQPQEVQLFEEVTTPPSRGTPYRTFSATMPVAASMGFWTEIGDYCAVRQLAYNAAPMRFRRKTVHGRYFPLCGMNLAFRPKDWWPWCQFIDVARFDDIWMGWLWQKEAYRRGYCFNLNGPLVRHSRQSNVWNNLRQETAYLKENETLWREIAVSNAETYHELRALLPC